jgi:hypothetical protein
MHHVLGFRSEHEVELKGSRIRALLKGCLWVGENGGNSEGGLDEVSQQPKLWSGFSTKSHSILHSC